jgi:hypothetical protein
MLAMDKLTGEPIGDGLDNLHLGVEQQNPKQFATGIAGCADDGNFESIAHDFWLPTFTT